MRRAFALCLTALLLAGCGTQAPPPLPETHSPDLAATAVPSSTREEAVVARCREVLDQIQSSSSHHITMTRWHEEIWDFTQQVEYFRHNEDRATISREAGGDVDGVNPEWFGTGINVQKDGLVYSGYQTEDSKIQWDEPNTNGMPYDPWLYTFDWEAQEVELAGIFDTSAGRCISFTVHAPYDIGYGIAENYTVNFIFDAKGTFLMLELIAAAEEYTPTYALDEAGNWLRIQPDDPRAEKTGNTVTQVKQMTLNSLDPEAIAASIDALYRQAITAEKG